MKNRSIQIKLKINCNLLNLFNYISTVYTESELKTIVSCKPNEIVNIKMSSLRERNSDFS